MVIRGITLSDAIGYRFEYDVYQRYPFLTWNDRGSNLPDFSTDEFYLEAKGQYKSYGGRIKPVQVEKFHDLDKPVFYILGWHLAKGLKKLETEMALDIVVKLIFSDISIIDNNLIESFFAMEQRFSKAQKPNGDNHYCVIKQNHINDIIENRLVKREGISVKTDEHYGIKRKNWDFSKINGIQLLVLKKNLPLIFNLIS